MRRLIAILLLSVSSCVGSTMTSDMTPPPADMTTTPVDVAAAPIDMSMDPVDMTAAPTDMAMAPIDMTVVLTSCVLGQSMINMCKL